MGAKVKAKMSKKAAQSAVAKGKSKSAGKKAAKPVKTRKSAKASPTVGLVQSKKEIDYRVMRSAEIKKRMCEIIPEVASHSVEMANMAAEVKGKSLWKEEGFDSWTAWGEHYATMMKVGRSSLFAMLGAMKALPGVTAEQRKKIGPRKVEKLKRAAKAHKEKTGEELPPKIIDAATNQPEKEFDETLKREGLAPEVPPAAEPLKIDAPDPLLHHEKSEQPFRRKGFQSSGAVEGESGDAQQFGSVVEQAVAAQQIIEPELSKIEALEKIAAQWMKFPCVLEAYQECSNFEAAAALSAMAAVTARNGKKRKK